MHSKYDEWNRIKKELEDNRNLPTFKEREIWWCSIGMNIGYEVFGKSEKFWRPVLILNKHNAHTFFGLPLGSVIKENSKFYHRLDFNDHPGSVLLSQGRTFSSKRLSNIMGKISEQKFADVQNAFVKSQIRMRKK